MQIPELTLLEPEWSLSRTHRENMNLGDAEIFPHPHSGNTTAQTSLTQSLLLIPTPVPLLQN